ncbi:expressed protein [Echinococcus multilocularis]|uniref:Expressed protein n=1 Tax=Echinococcus multilocularis TaxID=6211 RepID=A0A068Y228_ECHMU|nr:expressed protein [Echinococcus multilocularis]
MSPLLLTALLLFPAVLFDAAESCRRKCRIVGSLCDLRNVNCCDGLICKRLNRRYPTINYGECIFDRKRLMMGWTDFY